MSLVDLRESPPASVIDADVCVITSVDIDHVEYLGATREDIGGEKADIFRSGRPALCGLPCWRPSPLRTARPR